MSPEAISLIVFFGVFSLCAIRQIAERLDPRTDAEKRNEELYRRAKWTGRIYFESDRRGLIYDWRRSPQWRKSLKAECHRLGVDPDNLPPEDKEKAKRASEEREAEAKRQRETVSYDIGAESVPRLREQELNSRQRR